MNAEEHEQLLSEQRRREDELISRLRRECVNFRRENDEFDIEMQLALKNMTQDAIYDDAVFKSYEEESEVAGIDREPSGGRENAGSLEYCEWVRWANRRDRHGAL